MSFEHIYKPRLHRIAGCNASTLAVTVDGRAVEARAGDTLLTVLLNHDGWVRDSEFGDGKRSGFCVMGACQDCWVTLSDGRRLRACTTLAVSGMAIVRKQGTHV
ncbi:2Fe-2S iron-sulfur cluster protein [Hyphomicrobiales bacterium]|nr:2Fe-2S iron-sulfur cluster protein [Hyphomicrobiales bacterium]CAH1690781.1 2Fe-2S iron-sulfur cluster protein [Hyphomicrobiales bacterium]